MNSEISDNNGTVVKRGFVEEYVAKKFSHNGTVKRNTGLYDLAEFCLSFDNYKRTGFGL